MVLLLCAVQQSPALDLHGVTVVCGAAVSIPTLVVLLCVEQQSPVFGVSGADQNAFM